jgi:hypothetical protein
VRSKNQRELEALAGEVYRQNRRGDTECLVVLTVDLFLSVEHRIECVPFLIRRFVIALSQEPDRELIVLVFWEVWDMLRSEGISAANLIWRPSDEAACRRLLVV